MARRPSIRPRWMWSLMVASARLKRRCTVASVRPTSRAISRLDRPPKYASVTTCLSSDGSERRASSTAWRIMAPEKSFQACGLSSPLPMPSMSIFFSPL